MRSADSLGIQNRSLPVRQCPRYLQQTADSRLNHWNDAARADGQAKQLLPAHFAGVSLVEFKSL